MTGAASLEEQIAQVQSQALAPIHSPDSRDRLEAVRVDVLGRKGFARTVPQLRHQ